MKKIPLHSMVIMVAPAGAGKTTIVENKFHNYEVIRSDSIRYELVGDYYRSDVNDNVQQEMLRRAETKISLGERVILDGNFLTCRDRLDMVNIAIRYGIPIFYIVYNRSVEEKENTARGRRNIIQRQDQIFRIAEREILSGDGNMATVIDCRKDNFQVIDKIGNNTAEQIQNRGYRGVTVVGDVHGNLESFKDSVEWATTRNLFLIQLGDVVDYGPYSLDCINVLYDRVMRGCGISLVGNHERKIERWLDQQRKLKQDPDYLDGKKSIRLSEGNLATIRQIEELNLDDRRKFEAKFRAISGNARYHWIIAKTMFVHGAAEPEMFSINTHRLTGKFETIALFGEIDNSVLGENIHYPNRIYNWVDRIPSGHRVIVGHDIRNTERPFVQSGSRGGEAIFLDTGSGKSGHLSTADLFFKDDVLEIQNYNRY
jgi:predicted kinase